MTTIKIDHITLTVPSDWNQLTKKQLLYLVKLVEKESSYVEIQLKLLLHCIGGRVKHRIADGLHVIHCKQGKLPLFTDELASLLAVFDWIFDKKQDGTMEVAPKLIINHFKKTGCRMRRLYGPNDAMDNITYNDFVWLQTWQSQMNSNNDAVNELINVIYKTRSGKQEVKNVRRLPKNVKSAIIWNYLGTLFMLERMFPRVFSGSGSEPVNVFDNQQRIIDSLADGDVTKKDKVRSSLLYDALYSMEMAAVKAEQLEKEYKKHG